MMTRDTATPTTSFRMTTEEFDSWFCEAPLLAYELKMGGFRLVQYFMEPFGPVVTAHEETTNIVHVYPHNPSKVLRKLYFRQLIDRGLFDCLMFAVAASRSVGEA